jgi:hypothetical protein
MLGAVRHGKQEDAMSVLANIGTRCRRKLDEADGIKPTRLSGTNVKVRPSITRHVCDFAYILAYKYA